jgi:hypothetical protein
MKKSIRFVGILLGSFVLAAFRAGEVSSPIAEPPSEWLGNLKIRVVKTEQTVLIADSFIGPSTYLQVGQIYVRIQNSGDFPVCASLVPTVEEYKGAEWTYTQPIQTGFAYNPKIEKLRPGAQASGRYDFRPSPQKRDYVLVLQQAGQTQKCGARGADNNAAALDARTVRLSLSGNKTQP